MKELLRNAARSAGDFVVAVLALVAAGASFAGNDDAAYLFPRLIGAAWLGLCVVYFALRWRGAAAAANPDFAALRRAVPGGAVIIVYAALAETVGFYLAAFCAFLALATLYDRRGQRGGWRRVGARIAVTCIIIIVLRLVFSELLRVQTPRGILF